jgi:hypothetical protein
MTNVTRIDWAIRTGDQWWSGTDSRIQMEIYRDGDLIKRLNLEPRNTPRLHRGEFADYFWVFQDPDGLGVSVSGTTVPYSVKFRTASAATCEFGSSRRATTRGRRCRSRASSPAANCSTSPAPSTACGGWRTSSPSSSARTWSSALTPRRVTPAGRSSTDVPVRGPRARSTSSFRRHSCHATGRRPHRARGRLGPPGRGPPGWSAGSRCCRIGVPQRRAS